MEKRVGPLLVEYVWRRVGRVVSTLIFRSKSRCLKAQSLPKCCFLRQEKGTLLHNLSAPRCINGYWRHNVGGNPAIDQHSTGGGGVIMFLLPRATVTRHVGHLWLVQVFTIFFFNMNAPQSTESNLKREEKEMHVTL